MLLMKLTIATAKQSTSVNLNDLRGCSDENKRSIRNHNCEKK